MIEQLNNFEYGPVIFYVLATLMLVAILWYHRGKATNPFYRKGQPYSDRPRRLVSVSPSGRARFYRWTTFNRTGLVYPGEPPVQVTRPYKRIDGVRWLLNILVVLEIIFWGGQVVGIIVGGSFIHLCLAAMIVLTVIAYIFTHWDRKRGYK